MPESLDPNEVGRAANIGGGPTLLPVDIGHATHLALVSPETAFWSLLRKEKLAEVFTEGALLNAFREKEARFAQEMRVLRYGLTPSAVYFNPTERCNLNCRYCYIPAEMRSQGEHMSPARLLEALERLKAYFASVLPQGKKPQIIFHGAEPLMNREALFAGIERFAEDFLFGVQTNATLLDEGAIDFLTSRGVSIGISLDGPSPEIADKTRATWAGAGVFDAVSRVIDRLAEYPGFSVLCAVTSENLPHLTRMVEFLHERKVRNAMLNIVRCTLPGAREIKPSDAAAAAPFLAALERGYELYQETGRKLVIANFANALLGIVAPTARRLMCDISPCGGGRCFFALAANGDLFPCSEFVGLPEFAGGNLFRDELPAALESPAFTCVTTRRIEAIEPCGRCAFRHFCGAPCPAEAHSMNGGLDQRGAFCLFYQEQLKYALRLIADGREDAFLWDGWDEGAKTLFDARGALA
jgi:uncharacterized protein